MKPDQIIVGGVYAGRAVGGDTFTLYGFAREVQAVSVLWGEAHPRVEWGAVGPVPKYRRRYGRVLLARFALWAERQLTDAEVAELQKGASA